MVTSFFLSFSSACDVWYSVHDSCWNEWLAQIWLDLVTFSGMCHSVYNIYSALQKYWNSKDKIALLAVESRHLQIWLKYECDYRTSHFIIGWFNIYIFYQKKRTALLEFIPLIDVSISIGTVEHKADLKD